MASLNKILLIGHLGKDVELRYTPSGDAVATFSVATTEKFKGRDGQQQEVTTWHNIVAWRQLAEICGKFLHKGKQVYLEGKIQNRTYDDRDGNKKYISEVVIDQMQMLGSKGDGGGQQDRQAAPSRQQSDQATSGGGYGGGDYEEPPFNPDKEIPF